MEQGKIMEAEVLTVRVGAIPNRTNSAPTPTTAQGFYRPVALPAAKPTVSKHRTITLNL